MISDKPGCACDFVHKIRIKPDAQPVRQKTYRMSPQQQDKLWVEIDKLLADGMIEQSESEWSSPTILVPKPNGEVRCCVDLRKVNRLVIDESFPIPRIDDMVERIGKARFLTK